MGLKQYAIESLEIAQWNVLKAIFRLQPEDFEEEIKPNYNPINWMLGHLMIQMDYYFNYLCQGKRIVSEAFLQFYHPPRVDHEEIIDFPLSIKDLIDTFLEVSESSFNYLNSLTEEKFNELPEHNENNTEILSELIQRVSLHFMGHTGQIIWIKKHLGKGGAFVMGVKKKQREDSKIKWLQWWNENKEKYSID
ncbi:MAG: DinB family protein [Candidatus Heimdallarchaeota archaeon]|nr:DinB family protein [Candidatus Heimdallarchaeota archaeon]MBY8995829.1 DinB family protein [Candidatus Heimdallarchaeota archaeon]